MLLGAALATVLPATGRAQEYQVDRSAANTVTFISRAPIEEFEGVTDAIDGYAYWRGDGLAAGADYADSELYFEVDLNGLDTGIGLRNRHMRRNYLETHKYPYATYAGRSTRVSSVADGFLVSATGTLGIHGRKREAAVDCPASRTAGGYRIICRFRVSLKDFDIAIPSLMFMKISETIRLELDFFVQRVTEN